jgi:serine/threonine protein kinase
MLTRASLSEGGGGGDLLGTLPYMSPEQLGSAQKVDVRADIFSVGVILYRCVTGSFPFHGINLVEHARQLRGRPKDIRELARDVDATFAYTVHTAIATDRNDRYATARELQTALVEWMNRAQSIENLLGDYLGMNLRSDRPPQDREPSNPPKATDIPRKVEIDRPTIAEGKSSKTKEDLEVPLLPTTRAQPRRPGDRPVRSTKKLPEPARKPAPRTLPMQNAPTIPGMRTPTVPEMATPDERTDPKTTRRRR